MITTTTMDMDNMLEGFRLSNKTEGKSPKTIEWYASFLKRFQHFLIKSKLPTTLESIDRLHIRMFINYLQTEVKVPHSNRPISTSTVQGYVRSLKAFFSWAYREEYLKDNPMRLIPIPKGKAKIINTFSSEQIKRLLQSCVSSLHGHRDMVIILLFLDSGIRVSELIDIELDDVNLDDAHILIRQGKGNRERVVPIGSLVQKSLWRYINQYRRQPLIERITSLFLSNHGLQITRNGIQQMLRRLALKADISGVRCSPHTFRHTFAKNYLLNGGDIFSLQRILGHSSLASVRGYLNLFANDVKKQHRRYSPVDGMAESRILYPMLR
jgi:site-specific recombinase XerD